jgi:hypothetical protein
MSFNRFKRRVPSSEIRGRAGEHDLYRPAGDFFSNSDMSGDSNHPGEAGNRYVRSRINLIRRSDTGIQASRKKLANWESCRNKWSKRGRSSNSPSRIPESVLRERKLAEVRRRIAEGYYDSHEFMEELAGLLIENFGFSAE